VRAAAAAGAPPARLRVRARRASSALAAKGLDTLELKARAMQICSALEATLPADFDACGVIETSLAPPWRRPRRAPADRPRGEGLAGWILWPVGEFIARRGIDAPSARCTRCMR
jgi:hypothetical protein